MAKNSSFIVTETKDKHGKIITFENKTGECCWTGGFRKFRIIEGKIECVVELLEKKDFEVEMRGLLDESHERCIGDSARNFTYRCLDWIKEHFLLGKEGFIRGIVSPEPYQDEETEKWAKYEREMLKRHGFQPEDQKKRGKK